MTAGNKHRPSVQVTGSASGVLVTLHLLTPSGWARLGSLRRDGGPIEARMGEEPVAFADDDVGVARPADGVAMLRVGARLAKRDLPHPPAYVVVFNPAELTEDARAETDALLSRHAGMVAAARVGADTVSWGRVTRSLDRFTAAPSPTADRVVDAAREHDAASARPLGTVTVGIPLLHRIAEETGMTSTYDHDAGADVLVHRGVAIRTNVEIGAVGGSGDNVATTVGRLWGGDFELRIRHVLAGDYDADVADAYATLRRDGLDPHEALATAAALQG